MNVEEGSPRLPQSEGAAEAAAEPLVTIHEAQGLIRLHLGLRDLAAYDWLLDWIKTESIEPLYEKGVTRWGESRLPGDDAGGAPSRTPRPDPKHWHFRKGQLLEALQAHRKRFENPWLTRVPPPDAAGWISHALARGIVAAAVGSDLEVATAWLVSRSLSSGATLRARFRPRDLAQGEQISPREEFRALHPSLMADLAELDQGHGPVDVAGHAGCCLWFGPREALVAGICPGTGLTAADVEWREGELRDALARAFPTGRPALTRGECSGADIEQLAQDELSRRPNRDADGQEAGGEEQAGLADGQSADRPPSRGFSATDTKLVEEMCQLITSGRARNPWNAANALAHKAEGHGNPDSKARRLAKLYSVRKL